MRNLIFRFDLDNGKYAGTGHFKRVESLYFFLRKEFPDLKFYFLYKNLISSKDILKTLSSKNHIIYNKYYKKKLNFVNQDDIFIIDTPFGIDKNLKIFLEKKEVKKIIMIDDLNFPNLKNCTIINGIASFKRKIEKKNVKLYSGKKYLFLDEVYSKKIIKKNHNRFTVLITVGGTDRQNILKKILSTLIHFKDIEIIIIVGSQIDSNNFLKLKHRNLKIVKHKKNIFKFISVSDICITSGGIVMFESLALNKPTYVYQTFDHQKYAINKLLSTNKIVLIGRKKTFYKYKINKIINNYLTNKKKLRYNKSGIDRKSFFRVTNIIKKIIKK